MRALATAVRQDASTTTKRPGGGLRQIVLDTETTGLNAKLGDRIIEIGCVELASRRLTATTCTSGLRSLR